MLMSHILLRILAFILALSCNMKEHIPLVIIYTGIAVYFYKYYLVYYLITHIILRVPCVPMAVIGR